MSLLKKIPQAFQIQKRDYPIDSITGKLPWPGALVIPVGRVLSCSVSQGQRHSLIFLFSSCEFSPITEILSWFPTFMTRVPVLSLDQACCFCRFFQQGLDTFAHPSSLYQTGFQEYGSVLT